MMTKILLIAAALALAQVASALPTDKVDCSKLDEVLDDVGAAQGLSSLNDKYKLSVNMDEFSKRCQEMSEAIKTLRKYNKECYSSLTQQVFSAILRTRSQMNEFRCKLDSPEAKEAVESTKCIMENALENVRAAERKIILASQVILDSDIKEDKLRTRRACCAVHASKGFFLGATKDKCAKFEKIYAEYVDSYTSEAMGLICPEPEKLECDKLEPLKLDGVEPKTKFMLSPMLKLVKSLDH